LATFIDSEYLKYIHTTKRVKNDSQVVHFYSKQNALNVHYNAVSARLSEVPWDGHLGEVLSFNYDKGDSQIGGFVKAAIKMSSIF
jgi:hypothetical protein